MTGSELSQAKDSQDPRRERALSRERELTQQSWEAMDRADLLRELAITESEREAWERHGQEETFARERAERDAGIIIDNRHHQLEMIAKKLLALEEAAERVYAVFGDDDPMFESPCITALGSALREAKGESGLARTSAQFADSASPAAVPEEET